MIDPDAGHLTHDYDADAVCRRCGFDGGEWWDLRVELRAEWQETNPGVAWPPEEMAASAAPVCDTSEEPNR